MKFQINSCVTGHHYFIKPKAHKDIHTVSHIEEMILTHKTKLIPADTYQEEIYCINLHNRNNKK